MYNFNQQFIRSKDVDFYNTNNKGFSKWLYLQYKQNKFTDLYLTCDAVQDPHWPRQAEDTYTYYTYIQGLIDSGNVYNKILDDFTNLYSAYLRKPIIFLDRENFENLSYLIETIELNNYENIELYGKIISSDNLKKCKNLEIEMGFSYIYFLYFDNPSGLEIRYCGKTSNPASRLRQHISKPNTWLISQWIYSNLAKKKPLNMALCNIASFYDKQDSLVENAYIMALQYLGYNMLNTVRN